MKRIYAKEEVCIGCKLCEVHCAVEHSKSKNIRKAFKEYPKPKERVIVEYKGHISFALQCRHCEESPCVAACMTGAMQRDEETGVVTNDQNKCIGCWMCIMVCPYGAIKRDEEDKRVAMKCDMCPDSETPVCVAFCPNEALIYEER